MPRKPPPRASGSYADPISIDSSDEEPPRRTEPRRPESQTAPRSAVQFPFDLDLEESDPDDKLPFSVQVRNGIAAKNAARAAKEKEKEEQRKSRRTRDSDSEEDQRPKAKARSRVNTQSSPQKRARKDRSRRDSSGQEDSGDARPPPKKVKRSSTQTRDALPSQAGPSRTAFKETTGLGSWSNPVPLGTPKKVKKKSKTRSPTAPPGSWANPERLMVKPHPRPSQRPRQSPSPATSPVASPARPPASQGRHSKPRPTQAPQSSPPPAAQPKRKSSQAGPSQAELLQPSQVEPAFDPSSDPDEPSPPRGHRTTARKSGGGRAPRRQATQTQSASTASAASSARPVSGTGSQKVKSSTLAPAPSQPTATQHRARPTWATAAPGASPRLPATASDLLHVDIDELASGLDSGGNMGPMDHGDHRMDSLDAVFEGHVESDEPEEPEPELIPRKATSSGDVSPEAADLPAAASPNTQTKSPNVSAPQNGSASSSANPIKHGHIIEDDELEGMYLADKGATAAPRRSASVKATEPVKSVESAKVVDVAKQVEQEAEPVVPAKGQQDAAAVAAPSVESAQETSVESVAEAVVEPADLAAGPIVEEVTEPVLEPASQPMVEPVVELVEDPPVGPVDSAATPVVITALSTPEVHLEASGSATPPAALAVVDASPIVESPPGDNPTVTTESEKPAAAVTDDDVVMAPASDHEGAAVAPSTELAEDWEMVEEVEIVEETKITKEVKVVEVHNKSNGTESVTARLTRASEASSAAGPSPLGPALFPSSPDVIAWDALNPETSVEPEDELNWILYGEKEVDDFSTPLARPIPAPPLTADEIPPPGYKGKARRTVNEKCRQFLWEWNTDNDKFTENPRLHCSIFEAYVAMSVAGDNVTEPEAPEFIVDPSQNAAPPFEFFYTNDMFYSNDVPEPELGQGCGCEGPCDPSDQSCSCVRRQELFFYGLNHGFNYDKNGKIRQADCSVWECGPKCGCPPECQNRVIQRGRTKDVKLELFKTKNRGWGVRAKSWIPAYTYIGTYSGEVITDQQSEERGLLYDKTDRTYLFDLDGYQIGNPPSGVQKVDPRLAELYTKVTERIEIKSDDLGDKLYSAYSIDAFHFGFTRFLNHSCTPNVIISNAYVNDFHPERPILAMFTCREVTPDEELCISYKGEPTDNELPTPGPTPKRTPRRGISTKSTTTHIAGGKGLKTVCLCGSSRCNGSMFSWAKEEKKP